MADYRRRSPKRPIPAAYVPLPLRLIFWGVFGALSFRVTAPVRVPVAVGVNFTLIVQLDPAPTVLPHVPNPPKAKLPLIRKLPLKVSVALPVLVSVTYLTALVVPTA